MTAIKVLQVTDVEIDDYHLKNLTDALPKTVVDFSFVTFRSAETAIVRGMNSRGHRAIGLDVRDRKQYPSALRALGKVFRQVDPDIVHTNLFDPSLLGLTVAKLQGRSTVLTRHHSDAVHKIRSSVKRKFYLALDKYISNRADHIIAPSQMVRDVLVEDEKVPSAKVSVIPYAQTTERFDAVTQDEIAKVRDELGMNGRLSFVNVSRLFHRKGHEFLFEAFAKLLRKGVDANLFLVGEGEFRENLQGLCANLDLTDRVRFLGWRNDALAIVAAADVIVHPSLEDALSNAVIESLMLGKPIVATDISGVRDSLDNGKYGEIVPPSDPDAIRDGIERIIQDPEAAKARAERGRAYLLEYMGANKVATRYLDVYRSVLARSGRVRKQP